MIGYFLFGLKKEVVHAFLFEIKGTYYEAQVLPTKICEVRS